MTLKDIANAVSSYKENIILLYAFNATGKTRFSTTYKDVTREERTERKTGVYYNAYSEDLFVWDNNTIQLTIVPSSLNAFHSQITEEDVNNKLKPYNPKYDFFFTNVKDDDPGQGMASVSFFLRGDETQTPIKISRCEERIFIWCFFLALFETEGWAGEQNQYFIIDDPVSSLDDHNVFVTAFTLLDLIENNYQNRKIIVTTHHIGFASILGNWLSKGEKRDKFKKAYRMELLKRDGEELELVSPNHGVLLYHLRLLQIINDAIKSDSLELYHAALLRQVLENLSSFLGTGRISFVLQEIGFTDADRVASIENALTHRNVYYPQSDVLVPDNRQMIIDVFNRIMDRYHFVIQ